MVAHMIAPHRRLITCRSSVAWALALFVLCLADWQLVSSFVEGALESRAEPGRLSMLKQFLRDRASKSGCSAGMSSNDQLTKPPSAETLAIWEKQYSPSEWSVRFPTPVEVINHHVSFAKEVSDQNRDSLATRLDIEYGSGDREKVDIYGENLPDDAPLFVYIHGGYWQMLEKETSAYPAKPLVDRGIRVMVLGYELCPTVTLEELVQQIKKAGEFVLNYATEKGINHVALAGHSAGAHLIASMLDNEFKTAVSEEFSLLKDVYLISGVYTVDELRYTTSVNKENLLGLNDSNVRRLSPLSARYSHLQSAAFDGLRFHVYAAERDSDVFRSMASQMRTHLTSDGLSCDLEVLTGLDHFDIVENLANIDHPLTKAILKDFGKSSE
ncbi:kynurenine formamidase [Anopheles bellator]|uniref:kynurenine formamidase n=1 Tax=Anopheles bellator TaxID=139047 RepID=UPI00264718DB|nr:kynurenine formamidase [Anopheles bellator]